MELNGYLIEKESVSAKISAFDSPDEYSESRAGTLACTPYRLVFVHNGDVTDISLRGVNSIEYSEGGYPSEYFAWGLLSVLLAVFAVIFTSTGPISEDLGTILAVIGGIAGVGLWAWGFLLRNSTLQIHTAKKTYSFYSKEAGLDKIAHSVRAHEMNH